MSVAPRSGAPGEPNVVDITFTAAESSPPAAPDEPAAETPPAAVEPMVQVPAIASRRPQRAPEARQVAPLEPKASSAAPPEVMLALDPGTAARAFMVAERAAPPEASDAEREPTEAAEEGPRNYFEGVGGKQHLSVREPPKLRRHKDGTHRYKGHAFKAIVEKDGSVTFEQGYGQGTTIRFDLADAMMRRRGEDPYRVEKNWFLEATEELREGLFERWRAKQTLLALEKLRARLLRISENEALTGDEKGDRVIALYRDTSDGQTGASARSAIADFVEDRMPGLELPVSPR